MKYKRYGFWKEHNNSNVAYPSIIEYISKEINDTYAMERLVTYLRSAGIVGVTSGINFSNPFTKEAFSDSFAILTDGVWEWPEDLPNYIENNNVFIPSEWYEYIVSVDFNISQNVKLENTDIDWG